MLGGLDRSLSSMKSYERQHEHVWNHAGNIIMLLIFCLLYEMIANIC